MNLRKKAKRQKLQRAKVRENIEARRDKMREIYRKKNEKLFNDVDYLVAEINRGRALDELRKRDLITGEYHDEDLERLLIPMRLAKEVLKVDGIDDDSNTTAVWYLNKEVQHEQTTEKTQEDC